MSELQNNTSDTDELIAQIRREVARQKQYVAAADSALSETSTPLAAPISAPALIPPPPIALPQFVADDEEVPLPLKDNYELQELLRYEDSAFIANAFQAILGRPPDGEGGNYFLKKLRAGQLTKEDILGAFTGSPEARQGITIHGLDKSLKFRRRLNIPILGKLIALFHALSRLPAMAHEMQRLTTLEARWSGDVARHLEQFSAQCEQTLIQQTQHSALQLRAQAQHLQRHKAGVRSVGQIMDELAVLQSRMNALEVEWEQARKQPAR